MRDILAMFNLQKIGAQMRQLARKLHETEDSINKIVAVIDTRHSGKLSHQFQIGRNLRIIAWNANSVTSKKAELALFLKGNIDIAAIGETKLSPKSRFSIPGYVTYRTDINQFGGGVMILIKHTIRHDRFDVNNLAGLEASTSSQLLFVAAYLPPTTALSATDLDYIFFFLIKFICNM
jgi:hypothetical protein